MRRVMEKVLVVLYVLILLGSVYFALFHPKKIKASSICFELVDYDAKTGKVICNVSEDGNCCVVFPDN